MSHRELLVLTLSWVKVFFPLSCLSSFDKYLVLSENLLSAALTRKDINSAIMPLTAVPSYLSPSERIHTRSRPQIGRLGTTARGFAQEISERLRTNTREGWNKVRGLPQIPDMQFFISFSILSLTCFSTFFSHVNPYVEEKNTLRPR